MTTVFVVLALILMLAGVIGALIPNFPDSVLILAGAAILVIADGFTLADGILLGALVLIAVAAEGVGYVAQAYGAKKAGASWKGVVGALIGGLVGLFVFPPVGILIGPVVGAILGELLGGKKGKEAMRAGFGALAGVVGGVVFKFAAALTMVGLVVVSYFL